MTIDVSHCLQIYKPSFISEYLLLVKAIAHDEDPHFRSVHGICVYFL